MTVAPWAAGAALALTLDQLAPGLGFGAAVG
jgi:hypothetical protein